MFTGGQSSCPNHDLGIAEHVRQGRGRRPADDQAAGSAHRPATGYTDLRCDRLDRGCSSCRRRPLSQCDPRRRCHRPRPGRRIHRTRPQRALHDRLQAHRRRVVLPGPADQSPPRPAAVYGEWLSGWVDFDGTSVQVGSAHGDPGPFINGDGPELPSGKSLAFGDFRCRTDQIGVFCVNYAHRSAVRFAAAGIEPFGCLQPVPPPEGVGEKFSC